MDQVEILIPIAFFLMIALISISGIYFSFRKRAILVEKGYTADEILKILNHRKKQPVDFLKYGVLLLFVGFGFLAGSILEENTSQDFWFPSLITIGTAVGLYLASKVKQKDSEDN